MKTRSFLIILAVALILLLGYWLYGSRQKRALAPATRNPQTQTNGNQTENSSSTPVVPKSLPTQATSTSQNLSKLGLPAHLDTGAEADMGPDILVVEVVFDGKTFSPSPINIKVGDYVLFKNGSQGNFWPVADLDASGTGYAGFGATAAIGPGGRYQFQFQQVGSWGYRNKLNPSIIGVVNVTQK